MTTAEALGNASRFDDSVTHWSESESELPIQLEERARVPQQQCRDCVASIHTSEGADLLGNLKLYGDREPAVVSAWFRDLPILVFIARSCTFIGNDREVRAETSYSYAAIYYSDICQGN
ncbi:hypothetical protein Trisim1_000064 [Trichoderma cf. simile WF8]